jgi:hypothetical protein
MYLEIVGFEEPDITVRRLRKKLIHDGDTAGRGPGNINVV